MMSIRSGLFDSDRPVHWTADGRGVYVTPRGLIPAPVDIVDVMTGARKPWRTLMPPDPTGVHEILRIILTSDGSTYAYSFTRELSTLHALTGLK